MNKLILKGVDFGVQDLHTYIPDVPQNFCLWLTLSIGSKDVEGSHLFQVGVCTVTWLAHQLSINDAYVLRHMILVENFDYELIKKTVNEIIGKSERSRWEESLLILCRYFAWEFEDYQS